MEKRDKPRKGLISSLIKILGDLIIKTIRCWKFLKSSEIRKQFFRSLNLKRKEAAVLKKRTEQQNRRTSKKGRSNRIQVFARLQRMRLSHFHRRTPPQRLLVLYLAPVAILSLVFCTTLLLANSKVPAQALPPPVLSDKLRMTRLLSETAQLIRENKIEEAQKKLGALTQLAPDNPTVLTHTGAILLLKKNYDEARKNYQRALTVEPGSYVARFNLAEIEFLTNNYLEAERRFGELLNGTPRDETLLFRLYLCALLRNDTEGAGSYFQKLSPTGRTPAWHYATAARLFREKNDAEARKILEHARAIYTGNNEYFDSTLRQLGYLK